MASILIEKVVILITHIEIRDMYGFDRYFFFCLKEETTI